jgi:hypothetical protein
MTKVESERAFNDRTGGRNYTGFEIALSCRFGVLLCERS